VLDALLRAIERDAQRKNGNREMLARRPQA
jgi:hypothetical protein